MHKHKLKKNTATRYVLRFDCDCGKSYYIQRLTWKVLMSGRYTRIGIVTNGGFLTSNGQR